MTFFLKYEQILVMLWIYSWKFLISILLSDVLKDYWCVTSVMFLCFSRWSLEGAVFYLLKQWAAVTTQQGLMSEPPHRGWVPLDWDLSQRDTCQGQSPLKPYTYYINYNNMCAGLPWLHRGLKKLLSSDLIDLSPPMILRRRRWLLSLRPQVCRAMALSLMGSRV